MSQESDQAFDFTPPARKSKEITIEEAGRVIAGANSLHIMSNAVALVRAGIRAGAKGLTVIPQVTSSFTTDLLVAAGCVSRLYISYVGFETFGFAPAYRKAAQEGTIEVIESDEAFIVQGTRAAAGGMPFVPIKYVYAATDLGRLNKCLATVVDPFTGETMHAIPPLHADVCLVHAQECDIYGNAQLWTGNLQEHDKALASKFVIVSTDRLVSVERTKEVPQKVTLPGFMVDAVVHAPFGAHPLMSGRQYDMDHAHVKEYFEGFGKGEVDAYLQRYVHGVSEAEYLESIGAQRLLRLTRNI